MRKIRLVGSVVVPDKNGKVKTPQDAVVDLTMGSDYIEIPVTSRERALEHNGR